MKVGALCIKKEGAHFDTPSLHIPKKSSSHVYPHALTAYITGLLLTVYVVRIKKIALIHALILSQCFEVYFHINYLFSATYHFLIDRFDLI